MQDSQEHRFGGDWTKDKLNTLKKYLQAYTVALKKQPFEKYYIDAFAGDGSRIKRKNGDSGDVAQELLFAEETEGLLSGSARIALESDPPFDQYIFIDLSPERCAKLKQLKAEFPDRADRISIQQGDANERIRALCATLPWHRCRAVLFLDPYGMQVEWPTLEAIARTRAIDLWILFPLGVGVSRLLNNTGKIPEPRRRRLDLLFGTTDWFETFYKRPRTGNLFKDAEESWVKEKPEVIGRYFIDRLKTVFAAVADKPSVLKNSKNTILYLLCFAVGNKRGKIPAMKIAKHLLEEKR